jgi:hypothetical protein
MSAEILKEFLVSIGIRADEAQLKKAMGAISSLTQTVMGVGAAITAAAAAVEGGVTVMASRLSDLANAAQRIGSSVEGMEEMEHAFKRIGLSAGDADSLVKRLGLSLRFDPGTNGFLRGIGIQAKNAEDGIEQFAKLARNMPAVQAKAYAEQLHISDEELAALIDHAGELDKHRDEFAKATAAAGINQDKLADASKAFMQDLNTLGMHMFLVWERMEQQFLPMAERLVKWADDAAQWFLELDQRTGGLGTTFVAVGGTIAGIVGVLLTVVQAVKAVRAAWALLDAAFLASPIGIAIAAIVALGAAIYALWEDFAAWKSGAQHLLPWDKWQPEINALMAGLDSIGQAFGDLWEAVKPIVMALLDVLGAVAGAVADLGGIIWQWLGPRLTNMVKEGMGGLADVLGVVADSIGGVADILTGKWSKAWERAQDIAHHVLAAIMHSINSLTSGWPDWMRQAIGLPAIGNETDSQSVEAVPPPDTHDHSDEAKDHIASHDRRGAGGGGGAAGGNGSTAHSAGQDGKDTGASSGFFGQVKSWFGGLFGSAKARKDEAAPNAPAVPGAGNRGGSAGGQRTSPAVGDGAPGGAAATNRTVPVEHQPEIAAPGDIGSLSRHFESRGDAGAIGRDTTGGWSYGQYQIASQTGTMKAFMDYLSKNNPEMSKQLDAAGGAGGAAAGTQQFRDAFRVLASQNPQGFGQAQHDFIKSTHYDPEMRSLQKSGFDLTGRSKTMQDVLWSTAVAHGGGGGAKIIEGVIKRMGGDLSKISDKDLIDGIYAERPKHYGSSTAKVQAAAVNRYRAEDIMAQKELAAEQGGQPSPIAQQQARAAQPAKPGGPAPANQNGATAQPGQQQANDNMPSVLAGALLNPLALPAMLAAYLAPAAQNGAAIAGGAAVPLGQGPGGVPQGGPAGAATITQHNEVKIDVHADDAQQAGKAVADQQVQVNQQLTRNLRGAAS